MQGKKSLDYMNQEILLANIDKIHTTKMGINRVKKNLKLDTNDEIEYCKNIILDRKR